MYCILKETSKLVGEGCMGGFREGAEGAVASPLFFFLYLQNAFVRPRPF